MTNQLMRMAAAVAAATLLSGAAIAADAVPRFHVDAAWPKELPNNYILGNLGGVTVDAQDHVWVVTRPRTLEQTDMLDLTHQAGDCCRPAPAVIEFDAEGNFIQGWGGPNPSGGYEWPENEHGVAVDYKGNVWICGNGRHDDQCLKFTHDGKFLLQIGHSGQSKGSLDKENLNHAAQVAVWPQTNEAFIADGYANRRVIVFDADTGKFKRMWGAYGNVPDDTAPKDQVFDGPGPQQFSLVHGVIISKDGLVYVNDRRNSRIQVFTTDGKFVREGFVARATRNNSGTTFSSAFSSDPKQQFIYVADSVNFKIRVLDRQTLREIPEAAFGRGGPYAGQFEGLHVIATDSKGNIYTTESDFVGRLQKFVREN
jgi:sugar lactone lactonase YvrE